MNSVKYRPPSLLRRIWITKFHLPSWFAPASPLRVFFHRLKGTRIGRNVEIGYHVLIDNLYPELVSIGNGTTIVKGTVILAHDRARNVVKGHKIIVKPVRIGKKVFIGANSVILPGTRIGNGSIVAAGAVVTKDVPEGKVVAGVPAEVIGDV